MCRRPMALAWATAVGTLGMADVLLNRRHDGSTLSEATRWAFCTQHPLGRVAFVAAWAALTAWFVPHILRNPHSSS